MSIKTDFLKHQTVAESDTYYPFIDGLRGIAILMVIAVHTYGALGTTNLTFLGDYINAGQRGVQLFFMLSAFTLFNSSKRRFLKDSYPKLNFYLRRAFRILPFWWLIIAYLCFSIPIHHLSHAIPSVLFYFGFIRYDSAYDIVQGGWSLFVEETFYLFLPLIFRYITNISRTILLCVLTFILSLFWMNNSGRIFHVPVANGYIFSFPFVHWIFFCIGILIYFIFKNNSNNFIQWFSEKTESYFILDAAAILVLFLYFKGSNSFMSQSFCLMLLFIAAISPHAFFGKLVRQPILMRFGAYCYSIYLMQPILQGYIDDGMQKTYFSFLHLQNASIDLKFLAWYPFVSIIYLLAGFLAFNIIEKPCVLLGKKFIAWLNRFLDARRGIALKEKPVHQPT